MSKAKVATGAWLKDLAKRCNLKQVQIEHQLGYEDSWANVFFQGHRAAPPRLYWWLLIYAGKHKFFSHMGEVFRPLQQYMGLTPPAALDELRELKFNNILQAHKERAAATILSTHGYDLVSEEEMRVWQSSFLDWLEQQVPQYLSAAKQGVRLPDWYVPRDSVLAELTAYLQRPASVRLGVWGPGGSGKTVLAQALALQEVWYGRYPGGVLWAELGQQGQPETVLRTWGRYCGCSWPAEWASAEMRLALERRLHSRGAACLIILDDVWDVARAQEVLLQAPPGSSCVITVRERHVAQKLGLDDGLYEVPAWTPAEVTALVQCRLGAQGTPAAAGYALQLGELVEGLPLAVVLAVAQVKQQGWVPVLQGLQDARSALEQLSLTRAEQREHNLRLTLDVSYQHLASPAREVFAKLGLLAPGVPFAQKWLITSGQFLARDLAAADGLLAKVLKELVDVSLVQEEVADGWYRMHPLVQAYAWSQLSRPAERTKLQLALFEYWLRRLQLALDPLPRRGALVEGLQVAAEVWPQLQWAWEQLPGSWLQLDEDRVGEWLEVLGTWGSEYLCRQGAWALLVAWATHLWECYERRWPDAAGTQLWGTLLGQIILGYHMQGEWEAAQPWLARLRAADFEGHQPVWQLRGAVWEVRGHLVQGHLVQGQRAGLREECQRLAQAVDAGVDSWEGDVLKLTLLGETQEVLGDCAAYLELAEAAENHWRQAAEVYAILWQGQEPPGASGLRRVVRRMAEWRAAHGMWVGAARLGETWLLLELLFRREEEHFAAAAQVLEWALRGEVPAVAAGMVGYLQAWLADTAVPPEAGAAVLWLVVWAGQQGQWEAARVWSTQLSKTTLSPAMQDWAAALARAVVEEQLPPFPEVGAGAKYQEDALQLDFLRELRAWLRSLLGMDEK